MGDALKDFVITIGLVLGLISPQTDPSLACKILKTDEDVLFSLEINNCINDDIEQLITASNIIRVTIYISLGSGEERIALEVFHTIRYEPRSGYYTVFHSETGKAHRTDNQTAAFSIFSSFYYVPITDRGGFVSLKRKNVNFLASIELENDETYNPGVLWNYKKPVKQFKYKSIKEIPY